MQDSSQSGLVHRILDRYGLEAADILPYEEGYRNRSYPVRLASGQMGNLILYKVEPGILSKIRSANAVSNFLASCGFPTRCTLDDRIIALRYSGKVKYGSIYNYLPGRTIPWDAYSKNHIKVLGLAMSQMHAALRVTPSLSAPVSVVEVYEAIVARMQKYFANSSVSSALQIKLGISVNQDWLERFTSLLDSCGHLPDQQVLHMDFVRSNILFGGADSNLVVGNVRISGILDFEKTAYGHVSFDIARTLAFLLVDCKNKPQAKVRQYFLASGYNKRGEARFSPISIRRAGKTRPVLDELTDLFLFYDLYKFLRHNPYEFLPENEHFVRTRDLLTGRGLVRISELAPL